MFNKNFGPMAKCWLQRAKSSANAAEVFDFGAVLRQQALTWPL
jgi:hypothetical protein